MFFLIKILLTLALVTGVLLVPLGFPGTWMIFGAGVLSTLFLKIGSWWMLFFLLVMALLGELLEFWVGIYSGKKMNVSTGALVTSFIGGILGMMIGVPIFLIGSLLGLCLGVFLGAFAYELILHRSLKTALQAATAVFFSRLIASFVKTCIAIGMAIYLGVNLF